MGPADLDDDAAEIKFVADERVYLAPSDSTHGQFMVVFGELAQQVDQEGRLTLPFVALIHRPDGSVLVVDDAALDFPVHAEESGETHTVILRGVDDQGAVPKGSVIVAQTRGA